MTRRVTGARRAHRVAYGGLVAAVGLERLAELRVARRNEAWARERGAQELGAAHYPFMVALHTGLLAGSLAEAVLARRVWRPRVAWPMLATLAAAQGLRWWCIRSLGPQWNTKILVVPGAPVVTRGPYRWLHHPNYVAVAAEGVALPLVHGARLTAAAFTALNLPLLRHRIRTEDRALRG